MRAQHNVLRPQRFCAHFFYFLREPPNLLHQSRFHFVAYLKYCKLAVDRKMRSIGGGASDLLQWSMAEAKNFGLCAGATPRR
jgi:hypothetical protein